MVGRGRPILNSFNVAVIALGLLAETICLGQAGNAVTNSKTHSTAKRGTGHAAQLHSAFRPTPATTSSKPALPKNAETHLKPNGTGSLTQIRNLVLPIQTINERLIRDIMVGKPTEVVPSGTTESANPTQDSTASVAPSAPKDSETVSGSALNTDSETEKKQETPEAAPTKPADDKGGMKPEANNISTAETAQPKATESEQAAQTTATTSEVTQPAVTQSPETTTAQAPATQTIESAQSTSTVVEQASATQPVAVETAQQSGMQPDAPQINELANLPLHQAIGDTAEKRAAQIPENAQEEPIDSASVVKPTVIASAAPSVPPAEVTVANPVTLETTTQTELDAKSPHAESQTTVSAKTEEFDAAVAPATEATARAASKAEATIAAVPKAEEFDAAAAVPVMQTPERVESTAVIQNAERKPEQKVEEFDGASSTATPETPATPALSAVSPATPAVPIVTPETTTETKKPSNTPVTTKFDETINLNLPEGSVLSGEVAKETVTEEGAIVIDNDEAHETKETIAYKELPTDQGKTKVLIGAQFPVVMSSQITSKTAHRGDAIEARLKYDLKIGDKLIARKGAPVYGHINYCLKARTAMGSMISTERWYRNSGCVGVSFDEILNDKNEHIPLVAVPAQTARIIKNKGEGRVLGVNHAGQVAGPWSQQLQYKAIRIGLNAAMAPAGAFSFGAMPVALGVIGAANPSFAFMKPVGLNVRHRRIKGFAWGFLSGIPGSFLIEDTVIRGQEAVIKPGDEFLAEFKEEFTGEPQTDASIIAGASAKVHGQVMPEPKKPGKTHSKETSAK